MPSGLPGAPRDPGGCLPRGEVALQPSQAVPEAPVLRFGLTRWRDCPGTVSPQLWDHMQNTWAWELFPWRQKVLSLT